MESMIRMLTELALDPYAELDIERLGSLVSEGQRYSLAELGAALEPNSAESARAAGVDWTPAMTCSDPGPDEFDPFKPPS
jgi:hypothetical protein